MSKLEENTSGFLIFAFVFEIRPILFPHTLLWGVQATPNQHLLTLPGSSVGKSPDLHAEVWEFKPHSGHKFFFYTHTRSHTPRIHMVQLLAPLFRTIFLLSVAVACYTRALRNADTPNLTKLNLHEDDCTDRVCTNGSLRPLAVPLGFNQLETMSRKAEIHGEVFVHPTT